MSHELLPTTEQENNSPNDNKTSIAFSESLILEALSMRKLQLENIKQAISRKTLFRLEEKLAREEAECMELAEIYSGHAQHSKKYSFVLDPNYFEQKLLN